MIGMQTTAREIAPGRRLATARRIAQNLAGRNEIEELAIETVVGIDEQAVRLGNNAKVTLDGPDGRHDVIMTHTGFTGQQGRRVVWSDPLPENAKIALALVRAALLDAKGRRSTLLWVGASIGDLHYCHPLTDNGHADDQMVGGGRRFAHDPRATPFALPQNILPSMLIGVCGLRSDMVDGRMVTTPKHVEIVAHGLTLEQALDALPARGRGPGEFAGGNFASRYELEEAEGWGWARTEPSEALVLAWIESDELKATALARTGTAFHMQDDVDWYLEGQIPGPGLWRYSNAKMTGSYSHEGEYDQELSGDAAPADADDIERMFGPRHALEREIVEHIGEPVGIDDLIGQARQAPKD